MIGRIAPRVHPAFEGPQTSVSASPGKPNADDQQRLEGTRQFIGKNNDCNPGTGCAGNEGLGNN
jgi:hypothetical protein